MRPGQCTAWPYDECMTWVNVHEVQLEVMHLSPQGGASTAQANASACAYWLDQASSSP